MTRDEIVAAGIRSVQFIEPYPKSRVVELFGDSIVVDQEPDQHHVAFQAYIGIAPHRFSHLFAAPERVRDGAFIQWERVRVTAEPRLGNPLLAYEAREKEYLQLLEVALDSRNSSRRSGAKKSSRTRKASRKTK